MNNVTPYTILGSLNNQNILLVNVLGDKIPFNISTSSNSITKNEFEILLKNNQVNDKLVILYCASWSCGAADYYFNELKKRGINVNNIYDYKGALHEWASYSLIFPDKFQINNNTEKRRANPQEVTQLLEDTMHTYLLKDEHNNKLLEKISKEGESIFKNN